MAAAGMTLIQKFNYRGNPNEEFSNQYHFVGDAPTTNGDWLALELELIALVRAGLSNLVTIIRAYGYADTDDDAVWVDDLEGRSASVTGTVSSTGKTIAPGDSAAWVRWKTARTNSRGKPIYLRKYYHSIHLKGTTGDQYDQVDPTMATALDDLGNALNTAGTDWPGIAGPDGVAPGDSSVSPFVTTRTLKRRGARP